MLNGGPVAGKPKGGRDIQFGALLEGSPQATNATPQSNPSTNSLAVKTPSNPRVTSPQTSPSPIPQPAASGGGRPPSSLHGNSNSVSFGNFSGIEGNVSLSDPFEELFIDLEPLQVRPPSVPQGPLAPGPQSSHLRRESSQSQHSDMSSHGMGPNSGRSGYSAQGGRGRGNYQGAYPQQGGYFSGSNSRPPPSQPRGGSNMGSYQGQNRGLAPYPNSPHPAARSPALANAQLAHPQPGQVPMASPQMVPGPYGHPPYSGYAQNMGAPQVNPKSSSSPKHPSPMVPHADLYSAPSSRSYARQTIDLSPASGNFDQYLTSRNQAYYGVPQGYDPNYPQYYSQYPGMYPGMMPPSSPRPPNQMTSGPQQPQYLPGQYNQQGQPSPMSRTSSAISHTERPSSGMGRPPHTSTTPAVHNTAAASRQAANSPAPKPTSSFQIPPKKKSAGLVIKNPNTGDVVTFDKPASSPAPSSKSQTPAVASTPTPPPRVPSHSDTHDSRTESKSVKTDEEKRSEMREAIARKMAADKAEEQRKHSEEESKAAQEKKDAEDKILQDKADADKKQQEAAEAQMKADEAAKKEKAEAEEAEKAAAKAKEEADEAEEKVRKAKEDEEEIDRIEKEYAEMERLEQEREAAYQEKKKVEAEETARKEPERLKMADEEMKKAEAEAEALEEARLKELEKSEGKDSQKERVDMFAALKKDGAASSSHETPPAEDTPVASGHVTPASDAPATMAPPKGGSGKQKPAALKLETTKAVEPAQPTPQLLALRSARPLLSISEVSYPPTVASPNPALNTSAPMGKFRYDRNFLMQFEKAFREKPSENWDARVRETVGDTSEPSSARATPARGSAGGSMMTGRQPSNRAPIPAMGSFAQGGRTLPPGTTSQQRYEAAAQGRSVAPARPTMNNPLEPFVSGAGRGGFPQPGATGIKMDRTPSSTSFNHPNSPRNASQRGGSQRGSRAVGRREDPKDNKSMPITAGQNLKPIEVTATGWKPRSVGANATGMAGPAPGGDGHMAPDVVQRKVKSNLNKMTPNNFDKITIQILDISAQSKDENDGRTLRQVIQLTFEKATDEAHWAEMYAQFCKRMLESMSPEIKDENIRDKKGDVVHGGALFRKYLLNRCQEEFERGWKMNLGDKPEGETEEATMLSDQYYIEAAAKRRGLGLVRFIGELYKLGMLTERIMHECVKKLVDYEGIPDDAEVESLTSLLKTIGQPLDHTEKGPKMMDAYFTKINEMVVIDGLPSRLRFMLMVLRRIPALVLLVTNGLLGYRRSPKEELGRQRGCPQGAYHARRSPSSSKFILLVFCYLSNSS